jgi:cobalamin biosynthesis Mg chelatase CobN
VDWAAIESRPAPLPGPKAVGDFTQMFGRPDLGLPSKSEGAASSSQPAKPEGSINSFTSVFSPPKLEITEPKMETPAAAAAPKAAPAEPKQAAVAPKTQGPPLMLLAIVLLVIVIIAAGALYFFVIRK